MTAVGDVKSINSSNGSSSSNSKPTNRFRVSQASTAPQQSGKASSPEWPLMGRVIVQKLQDGELGHDKWLFCFDYIRESISTAWQRYESLGFSKTTNG